MCPQIWIKINRGEVTGPPKNEYWCFWGPSNRSGHGERKQTWQVLNGPYGPIQCLQFGNGSGHGERKQAWQALTGPFRSSQCLQLGERKHESGYRCESLIHLNTETFKHIKPFHESGLGEHKQAWQALTGPVVGWTQAWIWIQMWIP